MPIHRATQPEPQDVTLINLNLRFGLADDGENGWDHRKAGYPELIRACPADFYLFQEVNDFQLTFLDRLLTTHHHIGRRLPAPARWQNNVIFHHKRWRCVHSDHFYLSPTPDIPSKFRDSRWPRQCTLGVFRNQEQTLTVINTHLDFENEVQRLSAALIRRRADAVKAQGPAVVAGDFNAVPGSDCYTVLTRGLDGFSNAFDANGPGTFHGFSGNARGKAIDWVLFRGDLQVRWAEVIDRHFGGRYPSDHFPLWVRFGFHKPLSRAGDANERP